MAIQDSNAERRNLSVMSLGFIAFYYGNGYLHDGSLKFPLLSVSFDNYQFIAAMAWVLLIWFFYRYWQENYGKFSKNYTKEMHSFKDKKYVADFLSKKIGSPLAVNESRGYILSNLVRDNGRVYISYVFSENIDFDHEEGRITGYTVDKEGNVELSGFIGVIIRCRIAVECCFIYPSFSNYIIPYVLFVFSVCGPLYRLKGS